MEYECDFVILHDSGGIEVEEVRGFDAGNVSEAIKRVEELAQEEPSVLHKANVLRLRRGDTILHSINLGELNA